MLTPHRQGQAHAAAKNHANQERMNAMTRPAKTPQRERFIAAAVGLGVAALFFATSVRFAAKVGDSTVGLWSTLLTIAAGTAAAALTLWLRARSARAGFTLAVVLAVLALGMAWWIVMWGIQPFSLEGAWMWTTMLVTGIAAVATTRAAVRTRAGGDHIPQPETFP